MTVRRPLLACLLLGQAAVLLVPAAARPAPPSRLVAAAPVRQVTPPGHNMTEFQVAHDPADDRRIAVAAIDLDKAGAHAGCMTYLSADGGSTWRPINPLVQLPGGDRALSADPMVAFDRRGRLHVLCLLPQGGAGHPAQTLQTVYVRSDDFGGTWTVPVPVPTVEPDRAPDKPALLVLPSGRLVVCQLQSVGGDGTPLSGRSTTGIALSDDDGRSWSAFEPPSLAGYGASCVSLSRDGSGRVHMAFESLGDVKATAGTLASVTSRDGGRTWSAPVVVARKPYFPSPPEGTAFPFAPMGEADPRREIAYAAGTAPTADRRWAIVLSRSRDGGRTYRPVRPPAAPSKVCRSHMRNPVIHVDHAGRLALEFNCRDSLKTDEGTRETWLTVSLDHGTTWLRPVLLSREPAPACASPFVTGLVNQVDTCWRFADGADYWFITSTSRGIHAFWIDNSTGENAIRTRTFAITGTPSRRG